MFKSSTSLFFAVKMALVRSTKRSFCNFHQYLGTHFRDRFFFRRKNEMRPVEGPTEIFPSSNNCSENTSAYSSFFNATRVFVISSNVFTYLYHKFDDFKQALFDFVREWKLKFSRRTIK